MGQPPLPDFPSGNLYGTTRQQANGGGTVFKITPDGSNYSVLYRFCSQPSGSNCLDGESPAGGVIFDGVGNFYGTTRNGGIHNYGVVFEIAPGGTYTVLYSFCSLANCVDGGNPMGNLVALGNGNLYGTTNSAGTMGRGSVDLLHNPFLSNS